ncbi:MFS transporter [Henriciella barbarensis]|uniref:MFS transporter n=1 Tax=Henriciella barbarensis TaxID=86342 RepID=A0A399R028_9PROT|nr:MFS transporter [Henriciella barbarensis]RIJ24510.1 MFS transporter [Henriciella barbarensis]
MSGTSKAGATDGRETLSSAFHKYLKPTMAFMLVLGFASGLPLMMVFSKLSFWLREAGIDRASIGGLYAVSFAYSLKFLWAPAVDRIKLPVLTGLLGQRRGWMILAISGTSLGLLLISSSDPAVALTPVVIGALVLAFSGATLDIAVDAWRIESAPNDEQANMAAVYNLGYRFAIMFSGFGMVIAGATSWHFAYSLMAVVMLVIGAIVIFVISEPERVERLADESKSFAGKVKDAVIEPFWQLVRKFGLWAIPVAGIVTLYRISDFTMGVMASPFYVDLGYSRETVGWIQGMLGPWPIIVGGFVGGFVAVRYSLMRAMIAGGVITLLTNGAFAALAVAAGPDLDIVANAVSQGIAPPPGAEVHTPTVWALMGVIVADNLAAGFVGSVFIAYMSSLADRKFAATQYALLSSAYSFFCKLAATTTSGPLSEAIGWAGFFTVTALYTIPPVLLILFVMRYGPDRAKGIRIDEPEDLPADTVPNEKGPTTAKS